MVASYNDPVKQLAREKLASFIERTLFTYKRPRDVRVLCFPGAEKIGEEALEVKEVYDKLGIPRQNITGLEYDATTAERLRAARLGINIVTSDAHDVFARPTRRFDIISLDYTGQQGPRELSTLRNIRRHLALRNGGVLTTNYSAKREPKSRQEEMADVFIQEKVMEHYARHAEKNGQSITEFMRDMFTDAEHPMWHDIDSTAGNIEGKIRDGTTPLAELRSTITTNIVEAMAGLYDQDRGLPSALKAYPGFADIDRNIIERNRARYEELQKNNPSFFVRKSDLIDHDQLGKSFVIEHTHEMTSRLQQQSSLSERDAGHLLNALLARHYVWHVATAMERYSYNSNKNMTMHMDMFTFAHDETIGTMLDDIVRIDPRSGLVRWDPSGIGPRRILALCNQMGQKYNALGAREVPVPARIYLGSSWRPEERTSTTLHEEQRPTPETTPRSSTRITPISDPYVKRTISKDEAVTLLRAGFSSSEIASEYNGFTAGSLRAIKAHLTRQNGTLRTAQ